MKKLRIIKIVAIPVFFVFLMWVVKCYEFLYQTNFVQYGILPKEIVGLKGILFFPFIHQNFTHLINNTYPILILGSLLFYYYRKVGVFIFLWLFFLSGCFLWEIGRSQFHIGASGMVYALASFIFFSGLFKRNSRLAAASLLVIFLYGSLFWGLFPFLKNVSWEGHLAGLIAGIIVAFLYKKQGPQPTKYQWEDDEQEESDLAHPFDNPNEDK